PQTASCGYIQAVCGALSPGQQAVAGDLRAQSLFRSHPLRRADGASRGLRGSDAGSVPGSALACWSTGKSTGAPVDPRARLVIGLSGLWGPLPARAVMDPWKALRPDLALRAGMWHDSRHTVEARDRKSTRLNSSHVKISYAVFCLKKKI